MQNKVRTWLFRKLIEVYCYIYNYIKLPLPLSDKYLDASLTTSLTIAIVP